MHPFSNRNFKSEKTIVFEEHKPNPIPAWITKENLVQCNSYGLLVIRGASLCEVGVAYYSGNMTHLQTGLCGCAMFFETFICNAFMEKPVCMKPFLVVPLNSQWQNVALPHLCMHLSLHNSFSYFIECQGIKWVFIHKNFTMAKTWGFHFSYTSYPFCILWLQ